MLLKRNKKKSLYARFLFVQKRRGFILLETIVGIFILTTGILALYILTQQSIERSNVASAKITANYLAQEGIEIVRNRRDSNLLYQTYVPPYNFSWHNGITEPTVGESCSDISSFYEIDYDDSNFTGPNSGNPRYLKYNSSTGFYSYDNGNETQFQRKIFICDKHGHEKFTTLESGDEDPIIITEFLLDDFTVMVKIYWQDKEIASLREGLYNLFNVFKDIVK